MLSLSGVCAFLTVSTLFVILGYLLYNGGKSVNLDFFTQLPRPTGETGGGMANAIVGSAEIVVLATMIGIPIGFLSGIYLAEFGGTTFSFIVRYTADLLNGVPSIVIGIFAWTLVVVPMHQFSALAGGMALSLMLIPITARSTEQFLLGGAAVDARRRAGPGRKQVANHCDSHRPGGAQRHYDGHDSRRGSYLRRDAPLLFTSLAITFWSSSFCSQRPRLPVMIYTLRGGALRRLAPPGLGRRPGSAGPCIDREYRGAPDYLARHLAAKRMKTRMRQ